MFKLYPTSIFDVFIIEATRHKDSRGALSELFNDKFPVPGFRIKQVTTSMSKKGTLRGYHLQPGMAKIMMVLSGEALISTVDCRPTSPTYGLAVNAWVNAESDMKLIYAPDWAARAFLALKDDTTILYFQNEVFNPATSIGFHWESDISILPWKYSNIDPSTYIISDKDMKLPKFNEFDNPFKRAVQ